RTPTLGPPHPRGCHPAWLHRGRTMVFTARRRTGEGRRDGRRDGRLVTDLPALRRVVPHLMPSRLEATVYYRQHLEVERAVDWLARVNADRTPQERVRFFHLFLTAYARLFRARPELNRFVAARRTYEHRDI